MNPFKQHLIQFISFLSTKSHLPASTFPKIKLKKLYNDEALENRSVIENNFDHDISIV